MKDIINAVYEKLKNREIHPSGKFDSKNRFYAKNADLINVRQPSAAWPFSHMIACRTKKYVAKVAKKYNATTQDQLESLV